MAGCWATDHWYTLFETLSFEPGGEKPCWLLYPRLLKLVPWCLHFPIPKRRQGMNLLSPVPLGTTLHKQLRLRSDLRSLLNLLGVNSQPLECEYQE